jgi:hypothetical protein
VWFVNSRFFLSLAAAAALSACVDNAAFLDQPYERKLVTQDNYQAVYARTLEAVRYCYTRGFNPIPTNDFNVDGQLFSELRYGQIDYVIDGGLPTPIFSIRIEGTSEGTVVSGKVPAQFNNSPLDRYLPAWVEGRRDCPVL